MLLRSITKAAFTLLMLSALAPVRAQDLSVATFERAVVAVCNRSIASVVRVKAILPEEGGGVEADPRALRLRAGSGFFVDPKGEILTAASVVSGAHKIFIEWQNQRFEAKLVGIDRERSNLALLQVTGLPPQVHFPALPLDEKVSTDPGSLVIMLGFPGDLPASPSVGFVGSMAMYRNTPLMMTRVNTNPGESGAPFLNARGQVAGVLFGASSQLSSMAFALPTRAALRVAADLRQFGEPRYGSLGLNVRQVQVLTATNAPPQPAIRIEQVLPDTVSEQAGARPGDLLLSINQKPTRLLTDVAEAMFYLRVGEQAQIQILRSNQLAQIVMTVMPRPAPAAASTTQTDPSAPPAPVLVVPASFPNR
ncbi:MAG: S1C family serine protease [Verrucomicrobia bacterium]|nr:S1C family serine protease [Verrucomicrobiota bacterium]